MTRPTGMADFGYTISQGGFEEDDLRGITRLARVRKYSALKGATRGFGIG